jgi:oxygen-independent coproporphyrinogen-3 oxidase
LTLNGARHATEALRVPGAWLQAVEERGSGEIPREVVPGQELAEEYALMGLRLAEGIEARPLRTDPTLSRRINGLISSCLLEESQGRLRTTPAGRPLLNAILREMFA